MTTKPQLILSALALTGLWLSPGAPRAATLNWNCTSDNWATTTCWSPNGTPTGADDVYIYTVMGANTGLTIDTTTGAAVANTVTVDATAPTTVTVDQSGGSLAAGWEYVGDSGTGAFTQSGGTNTVTRSLYLGTWAGASGTYALSAGSLAAGFEWVGTNGTGAFTQSGGTNTVASTLYLGSNSTASGSYALSAGDLAAGSETVGSSGTGAFTQSGGTNTVDFSLYLGSNSTGSGTYALSGGDLAAGSEFVGYDGTGAFTQTGGTNTVATTLTLAVNAGASGTYNLGGGTLTVGSLAKGGGTGTFNFNAGTLNFAGDLLLDATSLLDGNLVLTGVKTLGVGGTTTLGGANTLTLDGGTFSTGSLANNGGFAFNKGTFNLTNDNLVVGAGGLFGGSVQFGGNQTVNVTHTTTIDSGSVLALNDSAFSSGTTNNNGQVALGGVNTNLGGGTVNNAGKITGSGQVSATLNNMGSGEVRANAGDALVFSGTGNTSDGRITLLGGSVDSPQGLTNTGIISGRGVVATGTTGATGLTNQGNVAVSGTTDFIGDVSNTGAGKIVVSGGATATFHDDVTHNGAEIRVSAGSQAVFFGAVSGAGAYTGTGTVFFEGDLRPGNSPALVTVEGDMSLGLLSLTTMELGGLLRGAEYDAFDVGGTLSLGGTLDVVLFDLGGGLFAPSAGDSFDLLTATTISGTFDSLAFPALGGGLAFNLAYLLDPNGIDIARLTVQAVPEPASMALVASALCGVIGLARRRRG